MVAVDPQTAVRPRRTDSALVLRLQPAIDLTREQFFHFCQLNSEVRIELTADGEIAIMPPTGGETGARNMRVGAQVARWADEDGSGVVFDSSTGFELPNGAVRSPDVAWVANARLARLSMEEKRRFLPLCPDLDGGVPGKWRSTWLALGSRPAASGRLLRRRSRGVARTADLDCR